MISMRLNRLVQSDVLRWDQNVVVKHVIEARSHVQPRQLDTARYGAMCACKFLLKMLWRLLERYKSWKPRFHPQHGILSINHSTRIVVRIGGGALSKRSASTGIE
jgi:hypothetical protein